MKYLIRLLICVLMVCSMASMGFSQQEQPQQQRAYKFFDGNDWNNIEKLSIAPQLKIMTKSLILRAVYESTVFSGAPVVEVDRTVLNYIPDIDAFYKIEENRTIPLFFALKITEQYKKGASLAAVENYKNAIRERLREAGVIKK